MNRILTTIIALWSMCTMAGLPPTTLSGEQATTKPTTFTFETPNYQATQVSGIKSRVETGNTNLLVNPSFEHSTVTTGWTITNATASADTTNQVEGKKALSLALTGALSVVQDSTINAANLVGLQGNAGIKIKTSDVDGLKVCARNAGVTSTSLCINIPKDGVWKEINIPYILTATSNGIAITSTGTTGTVKLDDAFVGTSAPFQGVNGAKLVGTLTYAAATNCQWATSSSSFADFAADTDCATPTVTGSLVARATKIPGFTINNALPGTYRIVASGLISRQTSVGQCAYRYYDGTNSSPVGQVGANTTNVYLPNFEGHINLNTTQSTWNVSLQALSSTGTAACYVELDTAVHAEELTFAVYYFPPESKIYSQASQDYDWTSYTPTFTGFGTVTNATFWHKREGSDLLIRGNFQTGTLTATTPSLTLPNGLSIDTTKIPSVVSLCSISQRGISATTGSQYTNYTAINPSTPTVLKFATGNNGLTGTNEITNATISFGNGEWESISTCRIPIQGWQDYGVIVGRFTDTVNDTGSVKPISKKAALTCTSSSAIISQGLGSSWITSIGNIASGACAVAITSGIFNSTPLCQITPRGNLATTTTWKITESSNTSISLYCTASGSNCTGGENVNIVCEGLGI